ncbi:MAG: hypothetical protein Q8P67_10750 [archaeon]|nr:hypothetical protein [archaeon]
MTLEGCRFVRTDDGFDKEMLGREKKKERDEKERSGVGEKREERALID